MRRGSTTIRRAPRSTRLLDPRADHGVSLGRVGAGEQEAVGLVEVVERVGAAGRARTTRSAPRPTGRGTAGSSCRCCECRARRASASGRGSSPRWSPATRRSRRPRPARRWRGSRRSRRRRSRAPRSQAGSLSRPPRRSSGVVSRSRERTKPCAKRPFTQACPRLTGPSRRGDRDDVVVAGMHVQRAADAAVPAGGGRGSIGRRSSSPAPTAPRSGRS